MNVWVAKEDLSFDRLRPITLDLLSCSYVRQASSANTNYTQPCLTSVKGLKKRGPSLSFKAVEQKSVTHQEEEEGKTGLRFHRVLHQQSLPHSFCNPRKYKEMTSA